MESFYRLLPLISFIVCYYWLGMSDMVAMRVAAAMAGMCSRKETASLKDTPRNTKKNLLKKGLFQKRFLAYLGLRIF